MSARCLAFARARRPVAVAMRVVAASRAADGAGRGARRSVFTVPRRGRRAIGREGSTVRPRPLPRGCEGLH